MKSVVSTAMALNTIWFHWNSMCYELVTPLLMLTWVRIILYKDNTWRDTL